MSLAAASTLSAVCRLAAPRSSAAPQTEGQRCSGGGGIQPCAFAVRHGAPARPASSAPAHAARTMNRRIELLPSLSRSLGGKPAAHSVVTVAGDSINASAAFAATAISDNFFFWLWLPIGL